MKKSKTVVIVGEGKVGKHSAGRLTALGFDVIFYDAKDGDMKKFEAFLDQVDPLAVFITISTKDKGEAALALIQTCIICGIHVITSEKGALSYHAEALKENLSWIGYSAAVGGGTLILRYLKDRFWDDQKVQIDSVLNGTLNFIFDEIGGGKKSLGEACEEAMILGYAEPGASDPLSLIKGEMKDVLMKTCVLFNTQLANQAFITPELFNFKDLTMDDLKYISSGEFQYRYIVSFLSHAFPNSNHWGIDPKFRNISLNPQKYSWLPKGVGNAVRITEGELGEGGVFTLDGPGAGLWPTTSAMLADFKRRCQL